MCPEADRLIRGDGNDRDLISEFAPIHEKIDAPNGDTLVIFNTHWIGASIILVGGLAPSKGFCTSDALTHVPAGVEYENARGTGNITVWFDVPLTAWQAA